MEILKKGLKNPYESFFFQIESGVYGMRKPGEVELQEEESDTFVGGDGVCEDITMVDFGCNSEDLSSSDYEEVLEEKVMKESIFESERKRKRNEREERERKRKKGSNTNSQPKGGREGEEDEILDDASLKIHETYVKQTYEKVYGCWDAAFRERYAKLVTSTWKKRAKAEPPSDYSKDIIPVKSMGLSNEEKKNESGDILKKYFPTPKGLRAKEEEKMWLNHLIGVSAIYYFFFNPHSPVGVKGGENDVVRKEIYPHLINWFRNDTKVFLRESAGINLFYELVVSVFYTQEIEEGREPSFIVYSESLRDLVGKTDDFLVTAAEDCVERLVHTCERLPKYEKVRQSFAKLLNSNPAEARECLSSFLFFVCLLTPAFSFVSSKVFPQIEEQILSYKTGCSYEKSEVQKKNKLYDYLYHFKADIHVQWAVRSILILFFRHPKTKMK